MLHEPLVLTPGARSIMGRVYRTITPHTGYWRPGEDYLHRIADAIRGKVEDYDTVVISEKAVSTALGNIIDENAIEPGWTARLLARLWMRFAWGYIFGPLCRLRATTIQHLRDYPLEEGSAHKELALEQAGLLQALLFGSEGGIDGSNLPYSYVSLPLASASQTAQEIHKHIEREPETIRNIMDSMVFAGLKKDVLVKETS